MFCCLLPTPSKSESNSVQLMTSKQFLDTKKLIIIYWLRKTCLSHKTPLDLIHVILEYTKTSIIFDLIDDNDNVWKNVIDYNKLKQSIVLKPNVKPPHEASFFCTTPFHVDLESQNKDLVISTTFKVDPPQPYVGFLVDCPSERTKSMSLMYNKINSIGYAYCLDDGDLYYLYPGNYEETNTDCKLEDSDKEATAEDKITMSFYPSIGYFKWLKNGNLIHSKNLQDLIEDTKKFFFPEKKVESIQNLAIYFVISFCVYSKYYGNTIERPVIQINL